MKPNLYTYKELNRTQSRESGTVLVLVPENLKADYEYENEYEYEKKVTFCKYAPKEHE